MQGGMVLQVKAKQAPEPKARPKVAPRASSEWSTSMHLVFWLAGVLPAYWLIQRHHAPSINRQFAKILLYPVSL